MSAKLSGCCGSSALRGLLIANSLENNTVSPTRTAVTSRIPRESVASKGIASTGYSKRLHILEIEFVNAAVYRYLEGASSLYRDLMRADSKARYYNRNIKGNYPSVRVPPRVKQETDSRSPNVGNGTS